MSLFIRLGMKSGGQADGSSKKAAKLRPKERGELLQVSWDECRTGEPEQVSLKGQQNIFLVLAWVLFNLSSVLQVTAPVSQE